jgi:exodeoxyribonuclease X
MTLIPVSSDRAKPDAYVTAWVLRNLLGAASLDDLIAWSRQPKLYPKLTFGRHCGEQWSDVPADYLQWLRAIRWKPPGGMAPKLN